MNQSQALGRLRELGTPFFTTADMAAVLKLSTAATNMVATRLAKNGLLVHLARGRWALGDRVNPLALPQHLAAPYPAYISLQSALFHYGMISQIPQVIYAATVAKTRRWSTPLGVVSLHQVAPDFFLDTNRQDRMVCKSRPLKRLCSTFSTLARVDRAYFPGCRSSNCHAVFPGRNCGQ